MKMPRGDKIWKWHVYPNDLRFPCLEPGWEKELAGLVECTVQVRVRNDVIEWPSIGYVPDRRQPCLSKPRQTKSPQTKKPPENTSSGFVIASGLKWSADAIVTLANDVGDLVTIPITSLAVRIFLRDGWKIMESHSAGPVTDTTPTAIPNRSETLSSEESGKTPSND